MQFTCHIILFALMFPLNLFASTDYWQIQHNESEGLHQNQSLTVSIDVTQLRASLLQAPLAISKNKVIIISAIDNLIKGASGQAVQNMNVAFKMKETLGLV